MKFIALVHNFYPYLIVWHTPNGEDRDPRTAIVLKAMGVRAGVPDLFFPSLRLFIEMKAPGEGMSDSQQELAELLRVVGYTVVTYTGHKAAFAYLEGFMRDRQPNGLPG